MTDLTPNEAAALAELEWELSAPHTLAAIAQHLGCSLRHVSRIEARALEKMRALAPESFQGGLSEPRATHRAIDGTPSDGMKRRFDEREGQ